MNSNTQNTQEAPQEVSYKNRVISVDTTEYGIIQIHSLPNKLGAFYDINQENLEELFNHETNLKKLFLETKNIQAQEIECIYPQDAEWMGRRNNKTKNGIIRAEELITFTTVDPQWDVLYITRSRPEMKGTNTPWQLDPGVLSHGWLSQAGVINAWRFVADKLWKNDNTLTPEEYITYLEENPLQNIGNIHNVWQFIIANGSNTRNTKKKDEGKELEQRTSWLLNIRALSISYENFQNILTSQNSNTNLETEYTAIILNDSTDTSTFTPKHLATHKLLLKKISEIENPFHDEQQKTITKAQDILD